MQIYIKNQKDVLKKILEKLESMEKPWKTEVFEQTFRKLTPTYQVILKLKYVYGYSVEEIAEKLSITFKSAESQLFRARKAFASYYAYGE